MFIREHVGARRATFTSSCSPIHTTAEVDLYSGLLPKHTRGCRTNFDTMARAYNNEVVHSLHQPQPVGEQGNHLCPKTARHLQSFDRTVAKELCRRGASGMMEALTRTAQQHSPSLTPGVQNVVDAMGMLMQAAKRQRGGAVGGENAPPAAAALMPAYPSKRREDKVTRQGEGQKTCAACKSWRPSVGGVTLGEHRKQCSAYQQKYGEK